MTELSPGARAIIGTADETDNPTDADRDRVRAALYAQLGIAGASLPASGALGQAAPVQSGALSTVGAAPAGFVGSSVAAKVALGLVLASGLGAVGYMGLAGDDTATSEATTKVELVATEQETDTVLQVAAPPVAPAEPGVQPALEATPPQAPARVAAAPVAKPVDVRRAKARTAKRRARRVVPARSAGSDEHELVSSLHQEKRIIGGAQRALRAGDPAKALKLLDKHAALFSGGILIQERSAYHAVALCQNGQHAKGSREVTAFLAKWSNSPLAKRVRSACDK